MSKTENKAPDKGKSAKPVHPWRKWVRRGAAALTHVVFALAILLVFVKDDAPNAASDASSPPGGVTQRDAGPKLQVEARNRASRKVPAPDMPDRGTREETVAPPPVEKTEPAPQPAGEFAGSAEKAAAPASMPPTTRNARLLDRLVAAYPDFLKGHDDTDLIWRDGTRMPFDDRKEKTAEERLAHADLEDAFNPPYPSGPMLEDPPEDFDPGRARNEAFLKKMYGNCRKGEVQKHLVSVDWLPKHGGKPVKITSVNGVADRLKEVSDELDALRQEFMKYVKPAAGTFNCRNVSRTELPSAHAYGIAIDINATYGDYWQWHKPDRSDRYAYRNRIPWEIAAIFEKHGFIWGGKWYHFDTLHFEYRPELISAAEANAPQPEGPPPMPEKQPRNLD